MYETPLEASDVRPRMVSGIRTHLTWWPAVVLILSFIVSFQELWYSTAIIGIGLFIWLFNKGKTYLERRYFTTCVMDWLLPIFIVVEIIAFTQSTFSANSRDYLLIVLNVVLVIEFTRKTMSSEMLFKSMSGAIGLIAGFYVILMIRKVIWMSSQIESLGFADLSLFRNAYVPLVAGNEWTLFLLLSLPFVLSLSLTARRIPAMISSILTIAIIYCIILGFSRGGYLALALFAAVFTGGLLWLHYRTILRKLIIGGSIAFFLVGAASIPHWHSIQTTVKMNHSISQERSTQSRWRMWEVSKSVLRSKPIFGVGAYNFGLQYNRDHYRSLDEAPLGRVTSIITQISTEKGLAGLLTYGFALLFVFGSALWFMRSGTGHPEFSRVLMLACTAAIAAGLIRELTMSTLLYRGFIFHLFCLVLAVILATSEKGWKSYQTSRTRSIALKLPLLVLIGLTIWQSVIGYQVSKSNHSVTRQLQAGSLVQAKLKAERMLKLAPEHPLSHVQAASAEVACGDTMTWDLIFSCNMTTSNSIHHLHQAKMLEPRDETIDFALGWMNAHDGQWDTAIYYLKEAFTTDPTISVYALTIGMIYEKQGDLKSAVEYYVRALSLTPDLCTSQFYQEFVVRNDSIDKGLLEMAIEYQALVPEQGSPIHQARLGALLFYTGEYARASLHLVQANSALPGMNRPYYYLGAIALINSDTARTIMLWDKANYLDPNDRVVLWRYGKLLTSTTPVRAVKMLKRARKPQTAESFHHKRRIYYRNVAAYRNSILPKPFMAYIKPMIDLNEIEGIMGTMGTRGIE